MKLKFRKMLVALVAFALVFTGLLSNETVALAGAGDATAIVIDEIMSKDDLTLVPGQVKHFLVPVKAIGGYMNSAYVKVEADKTAPFVISQAIISQKGDGTPFTGVSNYGTTYIEFDVDVKETAKIGSYPITITVSALSMETGEAYSQSLQITTKILKELAPAQISVSEVIAKSAMIGSDTDLFFKVKNEGEITARNTYISINYGTNKISPKYETPKIKVGDLEPGKDQYLSLPISILSTETTGLKTITINAEYKNVDGEAGKDSYDVFVNVTNNDQAPVILIDSITYDGELKPGNQVNMIATLYNDGNLKAEDINVKIDDQVSTGLGSDGIIKNYFTDSIRVGNAAKDGTITAKIPITVSKQATGGLKKLSLIISYTDQAGAPYQITTTVYPEIISGNTATDSKSNIIINSVRQDPAQPVAGGRLNVSFEMENKSAVDIAELKISLDGLTGSTFIPVESEPYQYIEKLAAGQKKRISIPLTVSDNIMEGLNNLTVKYTYISGGSPGSDTVVIPVHDVQNDLGSKSKPKVIVSKYSTDIEELRAGSTFKFTFDLRNTHTSVAAKNITVTVTQAENVFAVTQGSNSFFIAKIDPGETVTNTLEMKVKADATTKTYPLDIAIDYEYDGAEPNPQTGEIGESKTEKLNLQAVENSRPVIDNVNVYAWDGNVVVGNPATFHFEFYNMGKSPLNNVIAYIEGDFTKSDGNMYFVGNVAEGSSAYADFDVIPNMEGVSKGVLRITFEDSNGNQKELTKDFESPVQPASAAVMNPGMGQGGAGEVFNPTVPVAKKAIVPVWLFIIIQVIIFVLFIPITRKVIINIYKSKLRKQEQEQY
ncbi:MAG TPA: hypothetical protein VN131_00430 [Mobilitalea sp.]|nr:hypothetical protein [Mobilitalea sp.]